MSEDKTTPGPWEAQPKLFTGTDGGKHGYYEVTSNKGMFWIARVLGFSTGEDREQFKANARLIAAAPDLRDALLFARAYIAPGADPNGPVLQRIDAALRKANNQSEPEGESDMERARR